MTSYHLKKKRKTYLAEKERDEWRDLYAKEIYFLQAFLLPMRSVASTDNYITIMLIGNCPWPRPVEHFGIVILEITSINHFLSQPFVRLTFSASRFASRFSEPAAGLFRISIVLAETIARAIFKSVSFTVTGTRCRYSLIIAFSKKAPSRAVSSPF